MKNGMFLFVFLFATSFLRATSPPEEAAFYPLKGLMPKDEIGASEFQKKYPEYDGRGTVIAVIDSGIDPGAPGMKICPDGSPKIIDMIDASGSGDVVLSEPVRPKDGKIKGITGRELKLGRWKNPSREYRLGMKWAYDFLPPELVGRLKEKGKEQWMEDMNRLRAERDHEMPGLKEKAAGDKEKLDNLETLDRLLKGMEDDCEDLGPLYDCVVFHDGKDWCACIDTNQNGDLGDETVMKDYRVSHQVAVLDSVSMMNFTVKIEDSGDRLSIVVPSGAHGTHVAGIAAAYHPHKPGLNGMAPGAKLISIRIGDVRMQGASNGLGEIRACAYVSQHHEEIDLINVSWGGASINQDGQTLLSRLYGDLVEKYNIVACFSAGNEGPALSSAGSPGGETPALFGVAAYYSPELVSAEYNLRREIPENLHTFTSSGPCKNGYLGPEFAAPGAAVSSVPNYTLSHDQLMNGTSMAAPNACGGIALIISALKAQGIPYTVERLRYAIANTCRLLDHTSILAQGRGLLQIEKAYQYFMKYKDNPVLDIGYELKTEDNDYGAGPGYYRREPITGGPYIITVDVGARFPQHYENMKKVAVSRNFLLKSDAPWLEVPPYLHLAGDHRPFEVRIFPGKLAPGLNFSEITAMDSDEPGLGPVFRFPLTIIRPDSLEPSGGCRFKETLDFQQAGVIRRFLHVPPDAGAMQVTLKRPYASSGSNLYVAHFMQILEGKGSFNSSKKEYFTLDGGGEKTLWMPVTENRTIEICLAQFWRSLDPSSLELNISFHGAMAGCSAVHMDSAFPYAFLQLGGPVDENNLSMRAELCDRRSYLNAEKSEIRPMSRQELFRDNRQAYQLEQDFTLRAEQEGKLLLFTTAGDREEAPLFQDIPAPFYLLTDEGGMVVHQGMPDEQGSWLLSLKKGNYKVRVFFEALEKERLEMLKDLPLEVRRMLPKPVTVPVFPDYGALALKKEPITTIDLRSHGFQPVYLGRPEEKDFGDAFDGPAHYGGYIKVENGDLAAIPLYYHTHGKAESKDTEAPAPDSIEKLQQSITEMELKTLGKLSENNDQENFRQLAKRMLERDPDHLGALVEEILFDYKHKDGDEADRNEILKKIEAALSRIDQHALALYFTVNHREESGDERSEKEKTRRYLHQLQAVKAAVFRDTGSQAEFEEAYEEAFRWKPPDGKGDPVFEALTRKLYLDKNLLGLALESIVREIEDHPADRLLYRQKIEILKDLGLDFWVKYEEKSLLRKIPPVPFKY